MSVNLIYARLVLFYNASQYTLDSYSTSISFSILEQEYQHITLVACVPRDGNRSLSSKPALSGAGRGTPCAATSSSSSASNNRPRSNLNASSFTDQYLRAGAGAGLQTESRFASNERSHTPMLNTPSNASSLSHPSTSASVSDEPFWDMPNEQDGAVTYNRSFAPGSLVAAASASASATAAGTNASASFTSVHPMSNLDYLRNQHDKLERDKMEVENLNEERYSDAQSVSWRMLLSVLTVLCC